MTRILALALPLALVACGGPPPRTADMTNHEGLRNNQYANVVEARFPKFAEESDIQYAAAVEAHEDGDADKALHHTRLAAMLWLTAVYKSQAIDAQNATVESSKLGKAALAELKEATEERDRLVNDVTRLQRIAELEGKVQATENQAGAKAKLDAALVAVREAEALDAERHAPTELASAKNAWEAGTKALEGEDFSGAGRYAELAKQSAEKAKAKAAPLHSADESKRLQQEEDDKLVAMANKASGAKVSVTNGGILVILPDMFDLRESKPSIQYAGILDQMAEIAKKFPKRGILIEAHTDNRGGKSANVTLSQARADAVLAALAERGVTPGRMNSIGKGSAEPIADNKSKEGRAQNRRVNLLFTRAEAQ